LKNDLIQMPVVIGGIRDRGISFDLGTPQLAAILSASIEGKRNTSEMAELLNASLSGCQKCRARFFAPMSMDELQTMLKRWGSGDALVQEVRARQVKDLDISEGTANVLRAAGANETLVTLLVPDDKVKISPLIGYNTFELKHAEDYDPSAPAGWLKVTTELPANSTGEFVFKHNSLFGRAVNGGEPTNLGSYFNKPAPRKTGMELVDFNSNLESLDASGADDKRKAKPNDKAKDAPVIEVAYLGGDADGRNAFQIRLTNKQSRPQQYAFTVRWRVLTTPKPPEPSLKKPSGPKK
jgi:hypothetical protein